jgi:uncharacterized protein YdhG (YjbR/CyaY superfamily)
MSLARKTPDNASTPTPTSAAVDRYIAAQPEAIQARLHKIRAAIRRAAPLAEEMIGYGIPTYKLHGNLVHFGGYKNHIGFYPAPSGLQTFDEALAPYPRSKGAVQFPHDQPLPLGLIGKITRYRVKQNLDKAAAKKRAR